MSTFLKDLPRLDCHAHIAPDVTDHQVRALGDVFVFAVTRSLAEAETVHTSRHPQLVWGCGVHPRDAQAIAGYEESRFQATVDRFLLVGEIGLDAWTGTVQAQTDVLESILRVIAEMPVVCSIHSAGCTKEVVQLLAKHRPGGAILHWFTGDPGVIAKAVSLGCFFSVNVAMSDQQLLALPRNRVLPETDFPTVGRARGPSSPGDVGVLEERISRLWEESPGITRLQFFQNLRDLTIRSGTLERLPDDLAEVLIAA